MGHRQNLAVLGGNFSPSFIIDFKCIFNWFPEIKLNKNLKLFIQVNLGNEQQKSGINKRDLNKFYRKCTEELKLDIIGLMCIPPQGQEVQSYFRELADLNKSLGLKELSMGMSSDYLQAIDFGATFIRVGSKIFGDRTK